MILKFEWAVLIYVDDAWWVVFFKTTLFLVHTTMDHLRFYFLVLEVCFRCDTIFRLQSCVKVMIREDFVHNHGLNHIFGIDLGILGNVDGTADVSGRNKRNHADRGAESRKNNVLCHLAASSKGNIDTDMKNFLEDLVQASFTTFGEKFCQQFSDRLGKIETEVTQLRTASERTEQFETVVTDRLGKIEAEVTQLRTSLVVTELVGKSDQASGPSLTKINSGPSTSKKGTAPSKKKRKLQDDDD
ncbi:hypothetical protein HID58_014683 [Brassica napus]|uniref:Uncharacterized protein n=1 Tax=Brassica napus TaxID=3708 RepID=A0ABQ8DKF0_BRANA|nr:hypothetical protein HID58_014683 [Brassica napus]